MVDLNRSANNLTLIDDEVKKHRIEINMLKIDASFMKSTWSEINIGKFNDTCDKVKSLTQDFDIINNTTSNMVLQSEF